MNLEVPARVGKYMGEVIAIVIAEEPVPLSFICPCAGNVAKHPEPNGLNGKPSLCRHPLRQIPRTGSVQCRRQRQWQGSDTPVGK